MRQFLRKFIMRREYPYPITSRDVNRHIVSYLTPREALGIAHINKQFADIIQESVQRDPKYKMLFKLSCAIVSCKVLSLEWENYKPLMMTPKENKEALNRAVSKHSSVLLRLLNTDPHPHTDKVSIVSPLLDQKSPKNIETSLEIMTTSLWYTIYFTRHSDKKERNFVRLNRNQASLMIHLSEFCVLLLQGTSTSSGTTYNWTEDYTKAFFAALSKLKNKIEETGAVPTDNKILNLFGHYYFFVQHPIIFAEELSTPTSPSPSHHSNS